MPEMTFTVRWPDGTTQDCWSPSLVVHDHLTAPARYSVAEFARRSHAALTEASDRVQARYGSACTSALAVRREIASRAASFPPDAPVEVLRLLPPLPVPQTGGPS